MEDSELLSYFDLTPDEINQVPSETIEKFKIGIHSIKEELGEVKLLNTDLLKKIETLSNDDEIATKNEEFLALTKNLEKYKIEYANLERIKDGLISNDADTKKFVSELEQSSKNLKTQLKTLQEDFIEKDIQLRSSSEMIKNLLAENREAQLSKSSLMVREEELKSTENRLKSHEAYMKQEIELLRKENSQLHQQLSSVNSKLLTSRSELQDKCISLELDLNETKHQLLIFKDLAEKKREVSENLTRINDEYLEKIKKLQEEQLNSHRNFENEIESLKKLLKIYKETTASYEDQIEEQQSNIQELQKSIDEGVLLIKELTSEKEALIEEHLNEIEKEKTRAIELERELNNSKQLFEKFRISSLSEEELSNINPAVASTISALKRGKSLTDLYADYIQIVEERDMLKLDNKRLDEYIKELIQEIEMKGPMIKSCSIDSENMRHRISDTMNELEHLRTANKKMSSSYGAQQRKISYITRQNERLKKNCHDLACQVKALLTEIEINHGTVIRGDRTEDSFNHSFISIEDNIIDNLCSKHYAQANQAISKSLDLIDANVITYRNIGELVIQNQRLLVITKDLIDQLEMKETDSDQMSSILKEFEAKIGLISQQAEMNKTSLAERNAELEVVKNQRDSYKKLLEKYEIGIPNEEVTLKSCPDQANDDQSAPSNNSNATSCVSKTRVNENLIEVIESMKDEYAKYRQDKKESDQVYTKTIDDLREKLNESILKSQKLVSKLEFSEEKFKVLEVNVSGYKEEINLLREMNARYSASAAAADAEMLRIREDLLRYIEKEAKLEGQIQRQIQEIEQYKGQESRLKSECQILRSNEILHSQLTNYIKSLQLSLDHRENSDRQLDTHRLINLENQIKEMRSAHEYEKNELISSKKLILDESHILRKDLEDAKIELTELRAKLSSAQNELDISQKETHHFKNNSLILNTIGQSEDCADLKQKLFKAGEQISKLEVALESSKKVQEEFREISSTSEQRLNEILEQNKEIQERLNSEIENYEKKLKFLQERIDLQEKERQSLEKENIRINEEAHQMNAGLKNEILELTQVCEEAKQKAISAEMNEREARSQFSELSEAREEAKKKYERELCLHAQDLNILTDIRTKMEAFQLRNEQLQIEVTKAKADSESARLELENQAKDYEKEKKQFEEKQEAIEKNNDLLHVELVKLSDQLVKLRKVMHEENFDNKEIKNVLSTHLDDIKTSEDLLQVVDYLRKQKQIVESNFEVASMEVSRLLVRVEQLENHSKDLQNELNQSKEDRISKTHLNSQVHVDMMAKIDQFNLINESNQLLRQERDILRSKMKAHETKIEELDRELVPLREQIREQVDAIDRLKMSISSMEEERNRWKERCVNLVESAQRMDPETYREACQERDNLQAENQSLKTNYANLEREAKLSIDKLSKELTTLSASNEENGKKLQSTMEELQSLRSENANLKTQHSTSTNTINKLRELARKYKNEAESHNKSAIVKELAKTKELLVAAQADLNSSQNELSKDRASLELFEKSINELHTKLVEAIPTGLDIGSIPPPTGNTLEERLKKFLATLVPHYKQIIEQYESQKEKLIRLKMVEAQLAKYRQQQQQTNMSSSQTPSLQTLSQSPNKLKEADNSTQTTVPSNNVPVSCKQTAEIKPITSSNIATVMPTMSTSQHSNQLEIQQQSQPEDLAPPTRPQGGLFSFIPQNPSQQPSTVTEVMSQPSLFLPAIQHGDQPSTSTQAGESNQEGSTTTIDTPSKKSFGLKRPMPFAQTHQVEGDQDESNIEESSGQIDQTDDQTGKRLKYSETVQYSSEMDHQGQQEEVLETEEAIGDQEGDEPECSFTTMQHQFDVEESNSKDFMQAGPFMQQMLQTDAPPSQGEQNYTQEMPLEEDDASDADSNEYQEEEETEYAEEDALYDNNQEDEDDPEEEEEDPEEGEEDEEEIIELSSEGEDNDESNDGNAPPSHTQRPTQYNQDSQEESEGENQGASDEEEDGQNEQKNDENNEEALQSDEEDYLDNNQEVYEENEESPQQHLADEPEKPTESSAEPKPKSTGLFAQIGEKSATGSSLFATIPEISQPSSTFSFSQPILTTDLMQTQSQEPGSSAQIQPITWDKTNTPNQSMANSPQDKNQQPVVSKRKKKWGNAEKVVTTSRIPGPRFGN